MNVHIGAREDPQPLMLKLQAYREDSLQLLAVNVMKLVSLQISTTPWGTSTAWH
jgi:hypothetical protein